MRESITISRSWEEAEPAREAIDPDRAASEPWKRDLAEAVRDPDRLIEILGLSGGLRAAARAAARSFPLVAPVDFISRMRPGDPRDPLLLQVLPLGEEEAPSGTDPLDPVGDGAATWVPGLIRKYEGRVLLIAAGSCAVHCRYCFRRHFPYDSTPRGLAAWRPALDAIAGDASVHEVILSGGDPLILSDEPLAQLTAAIAAIPHVLRLRIHTRLPVVIPSRVTVRLLSWIRGTRLAPIVVIHANHPAELEGSCAEALQRMAGAGIPTLNQSVLLRGINDDAGTLVRLSERLLSLGILPYYLHQLDRVRGAAHFEVPESHGLALVAEMRRRLPGYAVPRYVKEVIGAPSKVDVAEIKVSRRP